MAMPQAHLRWSDDNPTGRQLHVVRHCLPPATTLGMHGHLDFAEVFWCESGDGEHLCNAEAMPLRAGDVVFIRPSDLHGFRSGGRGLTIVNVSFQPRSVRALAQRHREAWPWRVGPRPLAVRLPPSRMERLHGWAEELSAAGRRRLELDSFLLDCVRLATEAPGGDRAAGLPAWLRGALDVFADPRHLPGGTAALSRLCRRCPDHLNRVVRAAQGRTATDLVTEVRLDHAAMALRMRDRTIAEIATEAGLPNLGWFYRCFRQRFGTTPRRYRIAAWQRVRG